ncbi:hypothetical protein ACROYT_G019348 [Oculina patagonica]
MAVSGVWKQAYGALRYKENFHARCASGSVKVSCTAKHPVTIAAHETVVLWGLAHVCPGELTKVVVEPLDKLQHDPLEVTPGLFCAIFYPHFRVSLAPLTAPGSPRMVQDGRPRVIAYGSRTLNDAERKYSAYRREFLALKWAVTEKFRPYLYGYKFHVVSDSNLLTYLVTSAKLSATDHRWLSSLASFDFTITYRAGKAHSNADGLSRLPRTLSSDAGTIPDEDYVKPFLDRLSPSSGEALDVCSSEAFQAVCQYHQVLEPFNANDIPLPAVEAISMSSQAVDHTLFGSSGSSLPVDWLSLQQKDPAISHVLNILHRNQPLDQLTLDNPELTWMFRERSRLVRKDGVLYRRRTVEDGVNLQLVLPNSLKLQVLQGFHDVLGHLG